MIQTVITHRCKKCQSEKIVRNGHNASGTPQYKCNACGAHGVLQSKRKTEQIDQAALERTYLERNSLRSTGRIFGISHVSVANLLKKKPGD